MLSMILSLFIISQPEGIKVTEDVVVPRVLQKTELTSEEMEALVNTVGGIFMGISEDSNYVFVSEKPIKVDKKIFNFKDLPEKGDDVFIRMEKRGREKVGIFAAKTLDEAVYYRKKRILR